MERIALYDYRRARRMTQEELATKVGVTRQQIRNYETGINNMPAKKAMKIAEILNVADWSELYKTQEL